ncbi:MAG: hypothetical protein ACW99U_19260 [Candidatus Thorarchaeota archaeon]|jgi:hypothetical protein
MKAEFVEVKIQANPALAHATGLQRRRFKADDQFEGQDNGTVFGRCDVEFETAHRTFTEEMYVRYVKDTEGKTRWAVLMNEFEEHL